MLPFALFGTCIAFKGLTFLFLFLAYLNARCRGSKQNAYEVRTPSQPNQVMTHTEANKTVALTRSNQVQTLSVSTSTIETVVL